MKFISYVLPRIGLVLAAASIILLYVSFCIASDPLMYRGVVLMLIGGICTLPCFVEDWKNGKEF